MIQQVLNKQLLQDVLKEMRSQADSVSDDDRRSLTDTPMDDLDASEREDLIVGTAAAGQFLENEQADSDRRGGEEEVPAADRNAYIPRSPELSNLQSAIEQYFLEERGELVDSSGEDDDRRGGAAPIAGEQLTVWQDYLSDRRIFGAFEQTDIGWINSLFAKGIRRFRKKHPFVDRPVRKEPIALPDENLRIIVFGDWGSGVPRAQALAQLIRRELDDPKVKDCQKHVIHLGDVYYSGWDYEYKKRFLKYWPVAPEEKDVIGSFNLNGNHDMYSGGWAYYDSCLAEERFMPWQGQSSLFHLRNQYWDLFGLDTSHDDAGLKGDQAQWIVNAGRRDRKTMLLSHHQYCSAFEEASPAVIDGIQPVLQGLDVAAWLWGHEHRCMTFRDVARIRFPWCLGHGGVPVYQTRGKDEPVPAPGDWEYRDFVDGGVELWAKFGFVVLDFHRDKIAARFINEDGGEDRQEVMQ